MSKKQDRIDNLAKHYDRCSKLFDRGNCIHPKLIKKYKDNGKAISLYLLKLEQKLYKHTLGMCNDGNYDRDLWYIDLALAEESLTMMFPDVISDIKFNTDARGNVLKIKDSAMRSKDYDLELDFGGYGVLSPWIE